MAQESEHREANSHLEGRYANYFVVGHNAFEIVIDFGQFYEGDPRASFHTRIITSPKYAADLLEALQKSLEQHIKSFRSDQ